MKFKDIECEYLEIRIPNGLGPCSYRFHCKLTEKYVQLKKCRNCKKKE